MRIALNVVMVVLSLVPLWLGAIAIAAFLPDTVPMHMGFDGVVDGWGNKTDDMLLASLLTFANVIVALCGIFSERLWSIGLVNGVRSPQAVRVVCLGVIVLTDAVFVGILIWQMSYASA